MSNYEYDDKFNGISGTIDGNDFHPDFLLIEAAIATKADLNAATHTGTHNFDTLILSGDLTVNGSVTIDGGTY